MAFLKDIIQKIKIVVSRWSIYPKRNSKKITEQSKRVIPWFAINGDKTLRLNYDLNSDSLVWDLGGFEGQWSADIFCKYGCHIQIFEPVNDYARKIEDRFSNNSKVSVHQFGVSDKDSKEMITLSSDCSSIYILSDNMVEINLVEASNFFTQCTEKNIDLMKINIEGAEYTLLTYLIDKNLITKIKNIQVQFQDFMPDAFSQMRKIHKELEKTHYLTYQYEFVWENWKLKDY